MPGATTTTVAGATTTVPPVQPETEVLPVLDGGQCLVGPPGGTGEVFSRGSAAADLDPRRGWVVNTTLTGTGNESWNTLALQCNQGLETCPSRQLAIVLDNVIQSAPVVDVAEPWDVGPGGWRTGQFPEPFGEWNDRFRNAVRSFWLADPARAAHGLPGHRVRDLATRLSGSVDLFGHSDPPLAAARSRRSTTSPRTTASPWPTSWPTTTSTTRTTASTTGTGPTTTGPGTTASKGRSPGSPPRPTSCRCAASIRNLFATLVLAAGVPMITAGDEMGRSQKGNNNAYCQDSEISWVRWDLTPWRKDMLATARWLLTCVATTLLCATDSFFTGRSDTPGLDRTSPGTTRSASRSTTTGGTTRPSARSRWSARTTMPEHGHRHVVINGSLDAVAPRAADDHGGRWRLAWDSVWEHPNEEGRSRSRAGCTRSRVSRR